MSDAIRELLEECTPAATEGQRCFLRYTEKERSTCTFGHRKLISVDSRKYFHLNQCYRQQMPEYRDVCDQYDKYREGERRRGRTPASMGSWTPPRSLQVKYGDALPELLSGPPTVGEMLYKATLVDKERGMLIHLRCSLEEDECSLRKTRSSYIQGEFLETEPTTDRHFVGTTSSGHEKYVYFGRIHHFLEQKFAGSTHELAYVEWFKPPFHDDETKMWRVNLSLGLYKWLPYVFLDQIQTQVVVAQDPDDDNNLWILSPV